MGGTEPGWWPVLTALADGDWVSGQALADALGVSRTAVWKQVGRLEALGLTIENRPGRGYRLRERFELLDTAQIEEGLTENARRDLAALHVLAEVDSTNAWLQRDAAARTGTVVLAETQTAGRGRRGRPWVSPPGGNLFCSLRWVFGQGVAAIGGVGLVAGVAVARALQDQGVQVRVKWPNDLVVEDAKLGGILIETSGEMTGPADLVVGVGINLAVGPRGEVIDQPWTDLRRLGLEVSRNDLAASLVGELLTVFRRFEEEGLGPFLTEWRRLDDLAGRSVRVDTGRETVEGRAEGVDEQGRLLVRTAKGLERFYGGEVSVRKSGRGPG
ncbi:MAG: bifunctional biotin--[acetyl-CoA-carboxylase] ligase/biotin operon repressor BirA [Xanthomonadales bacterium]|nr:bifunctional biotin--[acetyl-CoA-carboxylase] ligase/biotin operon repressor BirA [Xanthomonadales bacterium]